MRICLAAGKLLIELLLELGIEEVLHAFRGLVEVVGGKIEVGFQEGFPQAVGPHDVAGSCAAFVGQFGVAS